MISSKIPMENSTYLFASDFHLASGDDSGRLALFRAFLEERAVGSDSLFILGDLFDYWAGSYMLRDAGLKPVFQCLRDLNRSGTPITLLPGNRDFLLSQKAAQDLGVRLAGETTSVEAGKERIFLTHGDIFCTFDRRYQRMKRILRNPATVMIAKSLPGWLVERMARRFRSHSMKAVGKKTPQETSLDMAKVQTTLAKGYTTVICGHIHRPTDERFEHGGRLMVLSDWSEKGGTYAEYRDGALKLKLFSN